MWSAASLHVRAKRLHTKSTTQRTHAPHSSGSDIPRGLDDERMRHYNDSPRPRLLHAVPEAVVWNSRAAAAWTVRPSVDGGAAASCHRCRELGDEAAPTRSCVRSMVGTAAGMGCSDDKATEGVLATITWWHREGGTRFALVAQPEDRDPLLDRLGDLQSIERFGIDLQRVFIEDYEVRQLAGLDRAVGSLLVVVRRPSDRLRLEALVCRQPLVGTDHGPRARDAVDRGPQHHDLVERADRVVAARDVSTPPRSSSNSARDGQPRPRGVRAPWRWSTHRECARLRTRCRTASIAPR